MAARIGAHTLHAQVNGVEHTKPAREAFLARFIRQAQEAARAAGEVLTEQELDRRARKLLQAHMQRLALTSSRRRADRRAGAGGGVAGRG